MRCHRCSAPLYPGQTFCPTCQAESAPKQPKGWQHGSQPLGGAMKLMLLTVRTDCKHCGHPIPVNGLLHQVECDTCHNHNPFTPEHWTAVLAAYDRGAPEVTAGEYEFKLTRPPEGVRCVECEEPIRPGRLRSQAFQARCHQCNAGLMHWVPEALRVRFPRLMGTFGAEYTRQEHGPQVQPASCEHAPVIMPCPQCGANLTVTSKSERTVGCDYCRAQAYIPDPLWRKLHPVRTVRPWGLCFEGGSVAAPVFVGRPVHRAAPIIRSTGASSAEATTRVVKWILIVTFVLPTVISLLVGVAIAIGAVMM